ncbi:hypothetical protein KBTX_01671 [wastewater metagenome]|uniref:Uncharacterized protein n=2 Tax=unclassified sequences TaxID=12908 RepID=A0A5B8R9T9_9ZZZZ|nr:abortive infection system antitoxin AbiGi family protein [Arhodomonas sp. KWT]QEA05351.1 hypothetical protein KBTEX_01671 [uncultured organism]
MTTQYASDELFHFVGHSSPQDDEENYRRLGLVLRSGCISHPPHDGSWGQTGYTATWDNRLETEELIVPTVTCYADIPFDALSTHVSKYGKFGLALPRWLLIKYGARPVMYIPMRSDDWQSINGLTLLRDIEAIVKGFNVQVYGKQGPSPVSRSLGQAPTTPESAISVVHSMLLKDFLAFIKPFNSELPHNHPDNFYMEQEWRKYGNMKFEPAQVSRLVVAQGYKDRAISDYPTYKGRINEI